MENTHDQLLSEAVYRLTKILGQYMTLYNDAIECTQNNLQVQKTTYMRKIVEGIVSRILEVKQALEKLEGSPYQFFGCGLLMIGKTTFDAEMKDILLRAKRPQIVQDAIDTAFQRVREKRDPSNNHEEENRSEIELDERLIAILGDVDAAKIIEKREQEHKRLELARERTKRVNMIIAQEKTRQVIKHVKHQQILRELWIMELSDIDRNEARLELREKAAHLLQRVFREYFAIKREKIKNCKLDWILGINFCKHPSIDNNFKVEEKYIDRPQLHTMYEIELAAERTKVKEQYLKKKGYDMSEDFRERIREWFREWFDSIQYIHHIPKDGSIEIFRDEFPEPLAWLEENEELLKEKQNTKGKTPQELKYEKDEAKRAEEKAKQEAKMLRKAEEELRKKMLKCPALHPGYDYPQSKRIHRLIKLIDNYHKAWDYYDKQDNVEVKRKYVNDIAVQDAYMEAKYEMLNEVDKYMETEHHKLKMALKVDYAKNGGVMPESIQHNKPKKQKIVKAVPSERIADRVEALALQGFIVEYPELKLEDFIGDPNFAGEDLRRLIQPAYPQNYEIRAQWWENCYAASRRFRRILLVGPDGSGKTKLVQALASMNEAVLFELDPTRITAELLTTANIKLMAKNILFCAKAVQPAVIHIKHVQKLYYKKKPPEEAHLQLDLIKRFFFRPLFRKVHKHDKITVVASCSDPWLTKSKEMLRQFPVVILLPNATYSLTVQLLHKWVAKYPSIPSDFNVSCLAHVLQGYTFAYIEQALENFMTAERRIKIAANGLNPRDVYNYIIEDDSSTKVEYDRYLKWYWENTSTGRKEKQHFIDLREFKQAVAEYEAKQAKKRRLALKSAASSMASSHVNLT